MSIPAVSPVERFEAPAVRDRIVDAADWIDGWARAAGLSDDVVFAMRLCVEEAVTNVVFYAYTASPSEGRFSVEAWLEGSEARLRIADQGAPFDVAAAKDPGIETDIESATMGGRGVRLMRSFSQGLAYERRNDANLLTLAFLRDGPPAGT